VQVSYRRQLDYHACFNTTYSNTSRWMRQFRVSVPCKCPGKLLMMKLEVGNTECVLARKIQVHFAVAGAKFAEQDKKCAFHLNRRQTSRTQQTTSTTRPIRSSYSPFISDLCISAWFLNFFTTTPGNDREETVQSCGAPMLGQSDQQCWIPLVSLSLQEDTLPFTGPIKWSAVGCT
jgi:hypothetical protein